MRGVYISKESNWPLWHFDFPHDCLTSYDFSADVTLQLHMCVSWTFTLHYILLQQVWPIVVMWPRQLMTQVDMTLLTCTGWLWCSCRAVFLSDGCALIITCLHFWMANCVGSLMVLVLLDGAHVCVPFSCCLLLVGLRGLLGPRFKVSCINQQNPTLLALLVTTRIAQAIVSPKAVLGDARTRLLHP